MEKVNYSDNIELAGRVLHLQTQTLGGKERVVSTLFDQGRVIDQREKEMGPALSSETIRSSIESYHRSRKQALFLINRIMPQVKQVAHDPSLFRLARLFFTWHLFEDARNVLEKADIPGDSNTETILLLSEIYAKEKQYAKAIQIVQGVLERNPDEATFWLALGWMYYRISNKDSAKETIDKALSFRPDSGKAHFLRGIFLLREEMGKATDENRDPERSEMVDAFKKAVNLASEYRLKTVAEAFKQIYSGAYEAALNILESVYDRTHILLAEESDFFYLNFVYGDAGRDEEAVRRFQAEIEKILEKNPNLPGRLGELGMTHLVLASESLRKAVEAFTEAERETHGDYAAPIPKDEIVSVYQNVGELLKLYFKKGG